MQVQSVEHHKKKGNYRPSRHEKRLENTAKKLTNIPDAPADFDGNMIALWYEVCTICKERGHLIQGIPFFIEQYVRVDFEIQELRETLKKQGRFIETKHGIQAHPAVSILLKSLGVFMQMSDKIGLNPKAMMLIKSNEPEPPKNPDDDLF